MKRLWVLASIVLVAFWAGSAQAAVKLSEIADKVEIDGEVRLRSEFRDGGDFGTRNTDTEQTLQRTRLGLRFFPKEKASGYIQLQDSRTWGTEGTDGDTGVQTSGDTDVQISGDEDEAFDLKQGYFLLNDFLVSNMSVKGGRQVLSYGSQRMLGGFDWDNLAFSHDAVKLSYELKKIFKVDTFASKLAELRGTDPDSDVALYGIYNSITPIENQKIDFYVLYEHDGTERGSGGTVSADRQGFPIEPTDSDPAEADQLDLVTLGLQFKGKAVGFDYDVEGVLQRGNYYANTARAQALHASMGYTIASLKKLRFGLAYNYASGDKDPTDGINETFHQPYPTNYMHFGYINYFAWKNMKEYRATVSIQPMDCLKLQVDGRVFELANTHDRWYGATRTTGGAQSSLRSTYTLDGTETGDPSNNVGEEIDFTFNYKYNEYFTLSGGYSLFIAGNFIRDQFKADSNSTNNSKKMVTEYNNWAFLMGRFAL